MYLYLLVLLGSLSIKRFYCFVIEFKVLLLSCTKLNFKDKFFKQISITNDISICEFILKRSYSFFWKLSFDLFIYSLNSLLTISAFYINALIINIFCSKECHIEIFDHFKCCWLVSSKFDGFL